MPQVDERMPPAIKEALETPTRRASTDETIPPEPAGEKRQPYFGSLDALVFTEDLATKGKRPYRVDCGSGITFYVFTNSKAQAALAVCGVTTLTRKEIIAAQSAALKSATTK